MLVNHSLLNAVVVLLKSEVRVSCASPRSITTLKFQLGLSLESLLHFCIAQLNNLTQQLFLPEYILIGTKYSKLSAKPHVNHNRV